MVVYLKKKKKKVSVSLWEGLETPVFCFDSQTCAPKS